MAEQDVNVISHLLDVEKEASSLIGDAQNESAKRMAAARAEADAEYKKQYDSLMSELESDYQTQTQAIVKKHDEDLDAYKKEIDSMTQNTEAFSTYLDSVLFTK
ncbi:MAG: hypothetical protein K6E51_10545 [Treponema sp.]|nr:hypothetical protein [Treponema sp.]